jgi:outer membrane protein assembly factor BamB
MKHPLGDSRKRPNISLAANSLLLFLVCLLLLAACGQSPSPGSAGSPIANTASANNHVAYVYTYYDSSSGETGLVGASARDGSVVWRAALGHANWEPVVVGDTLYANVHSQGSGTQNIVAVRVASGQVLWTTQLPPDAFNDVINADTTTVVVDAGDNGLYALDPKNGAIRWHLALLVERKPLVHAGIVYALIEKERFSFPSLNAYWASDGRLLWSIPNGSHNGRIELNSNAIYANLSTSELAAFSTHNGHSLWTGGGFLIAATDSAVFVEHGDNHLAAVSAQDGSLLWQSAINAGFYSVSYDVAPFVNGVLYIASSTGLAAVRARDGRLLWQHGSPNAENAAAAIVVNGVAYLYLSVSPYQSGGCGLSACTDQVVALNAATGTQLWQKSVPDGQLLAQPVANN